MFLSENQLQFVQEFLQKNEIKHSEFKEELLDHIATQIEQKMAGGSLFHVAAADSFESFQKDEMQEIQSQILSLNQKQLFMKNQTLKYLFGISIAISLFGAFLDIDEMIENNDIYLSIFEISMMSLILFVFLCSITGIGIFVKKSFSKIKKIL